MSWKQTFIMGATASLLSSFTCIVFSYLYMEALYVDFSLIVGTSTITAGCIIGCFLMAVGYKLAIQWKGNQTIVWLNIAFNSISIASIATIFGFNLPLEIESPELFPGLVIPMHLFPILSILTLFPLFKITNHENNI